MAPLPTVIVGDTNGRQDIFETLSRTFIKGDINGNAAVDDNDTDYLFMFFMYLFRSGAPPQCMDAADSNDDGRVNIPDVFLPPPPYQCAMDFGLDGLTCLVSPCD